MSTPTTKHSGAAMSSVGRNCQPWLCIRIALVYAPMPKKAPCPIDTCPL